MFLSFDDDLDDGPPCSLTDQIACDNFDGRASIHECVGDFCLTSNVQYTFPMSEDDQTSRVAFEYNSVIKRPQISWVNDDDESDNTFGIHFKTCVDKNCGSGFADNDFYNSEVEVPDVSDYYGPDDDDHQHRFLIQPETGFPMLIHSQFEDEYQD
eukprot:TRINITY_DN3344_c0_g1_i2.p1 TRINITY_DN3344_c0_g1~~TRINITY_DN3344_c0_g1_i2.p1  ORF type:complete len:155 (-),score=16.00 TRINITY_DN3344_c0_g1_i2:336-800(-)